MVKVDSGGSSASNGIRVILLRSKAQDVVKLNRIMRRRKQNTKVLQSVELSLSLCGSRTRDNDRSVPSCQVAYKLDIYVLRTSLTSTSTRRRFQACMLINKR